MSIKTNELQQLQSILSTDSLLADTAAAGTGRLSLAKAAEYFGAELVKPANPVGAALSNKAELFGVNLLHNWYFPEPVNQWGKTTYTNKVAYTIDRWKLDFVDTGSVVVNDGYISVVGHLEQITEIPYAAISGRTITASLLKKDGTLIAVTGTFPTDETNFLIGGGESGLNINYGGTSSGRLTYYIEPKVDGDDAIPNDIVAAKLEYGSRQTLARQDAAGNWVLNDPPPDPTLELLRCQRYFQTFATQSLRPTQGRDFRPVMRTAAPTLGTITLADGTVLYTASSEL